MAQDHRIVGPDEARIAFSCENRRFMTNITKGEPHSPYSSTLGNVLDTPLIDYGDYSLWLEHVTEKESGEEIYWLMWYDEQGCPTIPLSGVFGRGDLETMVGRLTRFVP
jgi:hypothetical protein